MLIKGWVRCTESSTVDVATTLWSCSDLPSPDQAALEAGGWGCFQPVPPTMVQLNVPAGPEWIGPIYCPLGDTVPGDRYFIGQTTGAMVATSWTPNPQFVSNP